MPSRTAEPAGSRGAARRARAPPGPAQNLNRAASADCRPTTSYHSGKVLCSLALSDRILVAKQGKVVVEFAGNEATQEGIMYAAIH